MKRRVIERSTPLRAVEHRRDVRERNVAGNTGDQRIVGLGWRAGDSEKGSAFELANVHPDSARGEVALDELLDRVVRRADRQQVERERLARALAHPV